jgi:hypothetical protein
MQAKVPDIPSHVVGPWLSEIPSPIIDERCTAPDGVWACEIRLIHVAGSEKQERDCNERFRKFVAYPFAVNLVKKLITKIISEASAMECNDHKMPF